jgi:hypothetical protein
MRIWTLAELMDRAWLRVTDDIGEQDLARFAQENAYKVGFANALQLVGNARADESDRMDGPIAEAQDPDAIIAALGL